MLKSEDKFDERGSLWEILKTKKMLIFLYPQQKKIKLEEITSIQKKLRGLLCFMAQP